VETCEPNMKNCETCQSGHCTKCVEGTKCALTCPEDSIHDYSIGACVEQCSGENSLVSYESLAGLNAPYCKHCSEDCSSCSLEDKVLTCQRCNDKDGSKQFAYQKECLTHCPYGTFSNGNSCQSCKDNCAQCSTEIKCEICFTGFDLLNNSTCIRSTSQSQFSMKGLH
jgi:hypothetical protein